jgi:hypothetical protein
LALETLAEGLETNEVQVHVEWQSQTSHTETQGSPITSYHLLWDEGSNGLTWTDVIGLGSNNLQTEYIITNKVQPGQFYNF